MNPKLSDLPPHILSKLTEQGKRPRVQSVSLDIPIRTISEANSRGHWHKGYGRKKKQQIAVACYMIDARDRLKQLKAPYVVTLTRIGKRKLDSDNLAHSFKGIRDEIAKRIGIDDGSDLFDWRYDQRIGKEYAVNILIEGKAA